MYAGHSLSGEDIADRKRVARSGVVYCIRPASDPLFFPGMGAEIVLVRDGLEQVIGVLGVVHPEVLTNFDIAYPCTVVELDVDALM